MLKNLKDLGSAMKKETAAKMRSALDLDLPHSVRASSSLAPLARSRLPPMRVVRCRIKRLTTQLLQAWRSRAA
jgi:hypothetical protein